VADGMALRINRDPSTGGVDYTAQDERLIAALGVMPDGASGLMSREGKRLGPGLECAISGDGLSVVVQPGLAVVNHALSSGGDYQVAIGTARTKTLAAKPGSGLNRRDTVVIDVQDEDHAAQKPTTLREVNILILQGTNASGTPTAPAAGTMQFEIGQVNFAGTGTPTIHPTNPRYTWAAGGIGVVHSQSERDGLSGYDGLVVHRKDTGLFEGRAGGAWKQFQLGEEDTGWLTSTAYFTIASGWSNNGTRLRRRGNRVRLELNVNRNGGTLSAGNFENTLVLTLLQSSYFPDPASDWQPTVGNNNDGGQVSLALNAAGLVQVWSSDMAINNGARLRAVLEYYVT
jgi:hypothetical protein